MSLRRCARSPPTAAASLCAIAFWLAVHVQPLSADVGLWFVRAPEPLVAPPGDEVVFECSLNVPAEQVRWRHAGRFLPATANDAAVAAGNHSAARAASHLVVKVVDETQAGDYQCVAWYGASALASVPARLSLAELKPFAPPRERKSYAAFEGNMVAIRLEPPESNPPAILQCHKDGRKLDTAVSSTGTLLLANVTQRDAGNYECSAYNYITGQTLHASHSLTLRVKPATSRGALAFLEPLQESYVVQAGWNVTLVCAASGSPPPRVTWSRYGGELPRDRAVRVDAGLALRHVVRSDEGTYICVLSNGQGPDLKLVISVQMHEPPVIVKEPANAVGAEGGDVTLECVVRGAPPPVVTWTLNGASVANDTQIKTNGARLHITSAGKHHAGIFQCLAVNALGAAYGSTLLQVSPRQVTAAAAADNTDANPDVTPIDSWGVGKSVPVPTAAAGGGKDHTRKAGAARRKDKHKHKGNTVMVPPTRPNITRLSDTSVMVRWSVPSNAGLPIQFFKVQHREMGRSSAGPARRRGGGGNKRWMTNNDDIPPHVRSYEVDGLDTEHTYRFRIAAVYSNNDNKLGPNSGRFHLHRATTGGRPALTPPALTHTEAVSSSAIQIHWHHDRQASAPIEGFYVYYRATSSAGDYVKATVDGEAARAFNVTHLQPDTAYDFKLQSFTVNGASDFSAILTHKTLVAPTEQPPRSSPPPEVVGASTGSAGIVTVGIAAAGGILLLAGIVLAIVLCRRRRRGAQDGRIEDEHKPSGVDSAALDVVALGKTRANGFLAPPKVNITTNPLAADTAALDKNQIVMEMSFLSSQNNNCSAGSEAGTSGGSSGSGDDTTPPPTPPVARAPAPKTMLAHRATAPKPVALPEPWRANSSGHSANQLVENYV